MSTFSALMLSLPARDSTVRMRVWRALKDTGCGVLRDGVYVLPKEAPTVAAFPEIETQVRSAGGFAVLVDLDFRTPAQLDHARKLFDRAKEYGVLVARVNGARASLAKLGKRKTDTTAQRLQRSFDELAAIDFFPGQAKLQAENAVQSFQGEARRLYSQGEPQALRGKVKRADPGKYRGRLWATRKSPWVDRLASAWLIKRFIDRDARFEWIESPRNRPRNAVGFDFDGAEFSHVGSRVTFEVLIAAFGLDSDPALAPIAAAVHFLDSGGIPVADAKGLETILRGSGEKARSDDERLSKACAVFDYLYAGHSSSS
jgi:hypothetical protein